MKPLTIEQLKALEVGDWVWVIRKEENQKGYAEIMSLSDDEIELHAHFFWLFLDISNYGAKWLAYKNKEQAECKGATYCPMCQNDIFDAYVPVSNEGDICERLAEPGEEWVYHANYCPNCGRRLISEEAERRLAELKGE